MKLQISKIITLAFFAICIISFVAFRSGAFNGNAAYLNSSQDSIPPKEVIAPSSKSDVIIPSSKYFIVTDELPIKKQKKDTLPKSEEVEIMPSSKSKPVFNEKDIVIPSSKSGVITDPDQLKEIMSSSKTGKPLRNRAFKRLERKARKKLQKEERKNQEEQ